MALNPCVGLVVFEVKDWSLGRYAFDRDRLVAKTASSVWFEEDPLAKSRWYAENMYRQFLICDEAELPIGVQPNNLSLFRNAVYFHQASSAQVRELYRNRERRLDILLGSDALRKDHLSGVVPFCYAERSKIIRDRQVEALGAAHSWLAPPSSALEQQQPLPRLNGEQLAFAKPDRGFRRIRGVAGAGKSLILAHRAANANREGRKILVLSYNITMSHVLRDLLRRAPHGLDWSRTSWGHFHAWARTQEKNAGLEGGQSVEQGLEQILERRNIARSFEAPKYGGIYVDEGQDFEPKWLDALAGFLDPEGEMVIVADHRQNLYGKDGGRDAGRLKRCRFSGPWAQLPRRTFRLPWRIAMTLNEFATSVSLGDNEDLALEDCIERPVQADLGIDVLAWRGVESSEDALEDVDRAIKEFGRPHVNDVVVLVANHRFGLSAVERLLPRYHQIVHVFAHRDAEKRRRKVAFWMGRGGLKICTIHSFKGWEIDNVIIIWPSDAELGGMSVEKRHALFYTALSRAMRNVVVLNANRGYDQYFKDWDMI